MSVHITIFSQNMKMNSEHMPPAHAGAYVLGGKEIGCSV